MPADVLNPELTQYDIPERLHWFRLDRRDFLKLCGGGLMVCLEGASVHGQESGGGFRGHELPKEVSAWLHIGEDGKVTVFTGKVEVGQNIRTSLAQVVAEELRVPFDAITMVMGDTDLTPWDAGTFGSLSTPTMGPQLRAMAATARQMLTASAARRWSVDLSTLTAAAGRVTDRKTGRSLSYGEITHGEKLTGIVSGDVPIVHAHLITNSLKFIRRIKRGISRLDKNHLRVPVDDRKYKSP